MASSVSTRTTSFLASRSSPAIGEHRLLADGCGAALLTPAAEVDWWCASRFDAAPSLWSLLDLDGPAARFDDVTPIAASSEPAAATAWTRLRAPCGVVEVHDGIVRGRLVRVVRCVDNDLQIRHRTGLRTFGGVQPTQWLPTELCAGRGELVALSITPDGVEAADARRSLDDLLAAAQAFRHDVAVHPGGRGYQQRRVREAIAVMVALRYAPTGAVVAAATTSLPEAPGHDRQFDYRYTWLRDGALAASVAALHKRLDLAESYLRFVERLGDQAFTAPLFTVDGAAVPREQTVNHVAGWSASLPIRVGNAASDQVQYDALGFVVEAVSTYTREGGRLGPNLWRLVREMADRCCADAASGDSNGIWEFRDARPLVSRDIGRWIALDRAIRIAKRRRPLFQVTRWATKRDEAAASVLAELRDDGRLPQCYGGDPNVVDAAGLLVVMFGMLDHDDPRAVRLVDAHLERLSEGPFLRRYTATVRDEFQGVDATFTPCSWWAVTALSAVGRHDDAEARCEAMCRRLPTLLAEEFDPATDQSLGNTPLLWSHAEAARTMRVLHAAAIRRRFGRAGLLAERAARRFSARS